MRIEVGTPVLLAFGSDKERDKSIYVGNVGNRHVLFSLPLTPGQMGKVSIGNRVTVRYLAQGTVYGFHVEVCDYKTHPAPLLFTTYPDRVEELEIRAHSRVDCNLPVSMRLSGGKEADGLITDISKGGCRLLFQVADAEALGTLNKGARLDAGFRFLGGEKEYDFQALVMHRSEEEGRVVLGLSFDGETDQGFPDLAKTYVDKVCCLLA